MSLTENIFISIPPKFEKILKRNQPFYHDVGTLLIPYSKIFDDNAHVFFPGYTDHGIKHINSVLADEEKLIPSAILKKLSPEEIGVLVLGTVFHDIGMQASPEVFKNMLEGKYDSEIEKNNYFNEKKWIELWNEYTKEYHYWDSEKKENVFGDKDCVIDIPKVDKLNNLNKNQEKFIGEFIRLHHCRNAHEIANRGYKAKETLGENKVDDLKKIIDLAGLVARSHGMDMRNTFPYLKEKYKSQWREPLGIHVVYLMSLLRIADALQIYKTRTSKEHLAANNIDSPYSQQEHKMHLSFENLSFKEKEETINVQADPKDAKTYVRCENEINKIQSELDRTWAILGEVYHNDYTLNYRRIHCEFICQDEKEFVPRKFSYRFNDSLAKKLVGPLYGNNPSFGVRELVQNAVDACRECKNKDEKDPPHVVVKLDTKKNLFTITDTGKGMTLEEIQKYFLTIGSSFNDNIDWKKWRDDNNVYRSGRFGIGVLAAFLLGDKICVETRSKEAETGYTFEAELGDKFIEIQKNDELKRGTTIKIKCDSESVAELLNQITHERTYTGIEWFNWYVDKEPSVSYFLDDRQLKLKFLSLDGFKKLKHSSQVFGDVFWKAKILFSVIINSNPALYCNGFMISENSSKAYFESKLYSYYDFHLPDLKIIDKYNSLPINLNRTQIISTYNYDFEIELVKETCKDMICQLMSLDYHQWIDFRIHMVFGTNGYFVQNNYIYKQINKTNLFQIFIKKDFIEMDILKIILNEFPKYYFKFTPLVNEQLVLHYFINTSNVFIYSKSLEPSIKYYIADLSKLFKKREYKECVILYKKLHDNNIFDKIIDYLSNILSSEFFFFIEEKNKYKVSNISPEVEDIFQNYLGDDPLIPFDLEKRKKKFPLIFQDFPNEIEYYTKFYQEEEIKKEEDRKWNQRQKKW